MVNLSTFLRKLRIFEFIRKLSCTVTSEFFSYVYLVLSHLIVFVVGVPKRIALLKKLSGKSYSENIGNTQACLFALDCYGNFIITKSR